MYKRVKQNKKGFLLISTLIVLSTLMIIVTFYLNAIIQEVRVFDIIDTSPQTYYLAEAGVHEAIWKLQNDSTWNTNFENDPAWSATITRNDVFGTNGDYEVTVQNVAIAHAVITATSTIPVRDTSAQRVVEVSVFKALNPDPIEASSIFANEDITGVGSVVVVSDGGLYANNDIDLSLFSNWSTPGAAQAVSDVDVSFTSNLTATQGIYDSANPPVPSGILMPSIDFDSEDPSSYKSQADQTYGANEFKQLLDDFPVTTLDGITYVTGNIYIKKKTTLTINGLLVADGSISVGNGFSFDPEPAVLTVNNVATTSPSGLLSKKNITVGGFNSQLDVQGLVYAGGKFLVKDGITQNVDANISGAIVAQDVEIAISWQPIEVELVEEFVNTTLGEPLFSQILFINHWEEEY